MKMIEQQQFVHDHANDDPVELLLSSSRYEGVDVKAAVVQIKARAVIKDKLPEWYDNGCLFFPSTIASEQCSSATTALYKQRFVWNSDCLCDLTGGLGVDTYFFSKKAGRVVYVEKDMNYCDAARYNMDILGATNVCVINGNAVEFVVNDDSRISDASVFYVDPARRGAGNKRMFALSDCEPDISKIWPMLLKKKCPVIVKLSPMLDITQILTQLPGICEIHVVSVKNECKELLAVAGNHSVVENLPADAVHNDEVVLQEKSGVNIICANYTSFGDEQIFRFRLPDEQNGEICLSREVERYLYEPNSSILKAGAYKSVTLRYEVKKLNISSHLYTSDNFITTFPGRVFEVMEIIPFNSRKCKLLASEIPQANITVRNFPLSVDELRKRTKITDGGDIYLFATTLHDGKKVMIKCCKTKASR